MSDVISIEQVNTLTADQVIRFQKALEERAYQLGINAYASGKIYKFINNITGEVLYVGSTKQELKQRKGGHLSFFKTCPDSAWTTYVMAIGGPTNIDMVLIELYPCRSKAELVEREAYWIRKLNPICNTNLRGPMADEDGDGNIVREQACQAKKKSIESLQSEKLMAMLNTNDVMEKEFDEIHQRVSTSCASEKDKLEHAKHLYKRAWGIDCVDREWIDEHGLEAGDPAVKKCMMMLDPALIHREQEGPEKSISMLQLSTIAEILKLFGWKHPFDIDKPVVIEQIFKKLMNTTLFREFDNRIKLFNKRAKPDKKVWKEGDVLKPLQTVLRTCGIEIESVVVSRSRENGQNIRKYSYSIQAEAATQLARLVNLRLRSFPADLDNAMMDHLEAVGFGPYSRLIQEQAAAHCDFLSDSDDEWHV